MAAIANPSNQLAEVIDGVFDCIQRSPLYFPILMIRSHLAKIHVFKVLDTFLVLSSLGWCLDHALLALHCFKQTCSHMRRLLVVDI